MNEKTAKILVDELVKYGNIRIPDKNSLYNELVSMEISNSSKFYEKIFCKKQLVEDGNSYHYISIRRILRNNMAKEFNSSLLKKTYESFKSKFNIYSSNSLSRNIRTDKKLVDLMSMSNEPFSLLGKIQSYYFDNFDSLFIITRPILIIPGSKDRSSIYNWQNDNTIYEKEYNLFGFIPVKKRINFKEYSSQ